MFVPITRQWLTTDARELEFYKLEHGEYPDSLTQLSNQNNMIMIGDATQNIYGKSKYFLYKRMGDHYTLYSAGPDGIAHTSDDIYPDIPDTGRIHYGWVKP
jgi:hypothetical protein